jgi:hypothetical protein
VDVDARAIYFSVNGSFESPLGLAFEGISADSVSPGLTASSGSCRVNFGDRPFVHSGPDVNYLSVHSALQ